MSEIQTSGVDISVLAVITRVLCIMNLAAGPNRCNKNARASLVMKVRRGTSPLSPSSRRSIECRSRATSPKLSPCSSHLSNGFFPSVRLASDDVSLGRYSFTGGRSAFRRKNALHDSQEMASKLYPRNATYGGDRRTHVDLTERTIATDNTFQIRPLTFADWLMR